MQKADAIKRNFAAEYEAQRPLTKKEVYKLPVGTWVELRWRDAPNTVQLLDRRVEPGKGDCSVYTLGVNKGRLVRDAHATHDQIVAIHGRLDMVAPTPNRS